MAFEITDHVFSHLCHQESSRAWVVTGVTLPLCARCTGVYAGAALVALTLPFARFDPSRRMLLCAGAAMLQMGVLGFNPFVEPPTLRMLSGSLFSAGAIYFLWLPIRAILWGVKADRPSPFLIAAAAAVALPQVLVRTNALWAASAVEALALVGVALLALIAMIDAVMITHSALARRPA
jgi:uncharacterized membrane protein